MTTSAIAIDFDVLKMASGVYRSGSFFKQETHTSLFHRDGKTASIDVIREEGSKAIVITTNGKPDASLYLDETRQPAHDATTQTLSGVMPMAVYPRAEEIAVIGFGSGMTSAMLLANPHLKRLDTIEIEPAMVDGVLDTSGPETRVCMTTLAVTSFMKMLGRTSPRKKPSMMSLFPSLQTHG